MPVPDITDLTLPDLVTLRAQVDERIELLRSIACGELRARYDAEAQALGLSVNDIAPARRRGRPRRSDANQHGTQGESNDQD